jgi:hypothetical protein
MLSLIMVDVLPGARDVSHLKNVLPLTHPFVQRFENNWYLMQQQSSRGEIPVRRTIQNLGLMAVATAVGVPELTANCVKYAVRGALDGCNWP